MVHSEFLFFQIIKLYKETTGEDKLQLDKLERAFYSLEEIISNYLGISLEYVFYEELDNLLDKYDNLFIMDDDGISFIDIDPYIIEEEIMINLSDNDFKYDCRLADYVQNIIIYHDLEIPVPIKDYQDIFDLNASIIQNYLTIAYQEINTGNISKYSLAILKSLVLYFNEMYNDLKYDDIARIKVVLAHYNDLFLLDGDSDVINMDWYIVLFSKENNQKHALFYNKLFYLISREEEDNSSFYEDDNEEETNDNTALEVMYLNNETDFFVYYFTIIFNQYLQMLDKSKAKDILILKKYLLIAINPDIEEYYLDKKTIDTLNLPVLKEGLICESSFMSMFLTAYELIDVFNHRDTMINDEVYADMFISAVFIKCFLNLCVNKNALNDIIKKIINSKFYKSNNYRIVSSLIDDIIFREKGLDLNRNIQL